LNRDETPESESTTLEQLHFTELSDIKCEYLAQKRWTSDPDVLVIRFFGRYRDGAHGEPDARFMCACIAAGIAAWQPYSIVLDLRQLLYEWGDEFAFVIDSACESVITSTAVLSEKNCDAVTTLFPQLHSRDSYEVSGFYFSLSGAIKAASMGIAAHFANQPMSEGLLLPVKQRASSPP
jgi:hypothetical protein